MQGMVLSKYFQGHFKLFANYCRKPSTKTATEELVTESNKQYSENQDSDRFGGFSEKEIISADTNLQLRLNVLKNEEEKLRNYYLLFQQANNLINPSKVKSTIHRKTKSKKKNLPNRFNFSSPLKYDTGNLTNVSYKYEDFANVGNCHVHSNSIVNVADCQNNNYFVSKEKLTSSHTTDVKTESFMPELSFDSKIKIEDVVGSNETKLNLKSEIDTCIKSIEMDFEFEYLKLKKGDCHNFTTEVKSETKPFELTSVWVPPRSPHNLIEEVLYHDPWSLLVATIFLNKTALRVARPYVFWFLTDNPSPMTVINLFPKDLEKYFKNLGLKRTRAVAIWRMSHDYVQKDWKSPSELYGIGEYGDCAYRMFCLGDFEVEPKDRFLRIYKAWYQKIIRRNAVEQKLSGHI